MLKAHQKLAWIIVWDDHEVVNDYWKDGVPSQWQNDHYMELILNRESKWISSVL